MYPRSPNLSIYPSILKGTKDPVFSPLDTTYKRTDVRTSSRRQWSMISALPAAIVFALCIFVFYLRSTSLINSARPQPSQTTPLSVPSKVPSSELTTLDSSEHDPPSQVSKSLSFAERNYTQALVVASTSREDTTWIARNFPTLESYIYVADDPGSPLRPPLNKGRESMQYLTYIVDHYDSLPDIVVFIHAENEAWHNNLVQGISMSRMLSHLIPSHVARVGFFNLRCHGESGCAAHIDLTKEDPDPEKPEQIWFRRSWEELHGRAVRMPDSLSAPCCSQFAATRETIQAIPLERWRHYRNWLLNTTLSDSISGRVWEFTWHFILAGRAELCPSMNACYCQGYGICFGSEASVENYLGLMEVDWFARKWQDTLRQEEKYNTAGEIDDHMVTGASRQLGHRFSVARERGRDPAVRAAADD